MNKKFNLLALAAAASACGALVLTSCGGNSGGASVVFWTNGDLRNQDTGKVITVPTQKVKYGKFAIQPDLGALQRKKAVRWTWMKDKKDVQPLSIDCWSYENEENPTNDFNFTMTPITKDTILYPVYKKDTTFHTVTLEPVDETLHVGTWNKESQKASHIYDDNYFEEGASLADFAACVKSATTLITPPKGFKFKHWYEEGQNKEVEFDWSSVTSINRNIVLIARYDI